MASSKKESGDQRPEAPRVWIKSTKIFILVIFIIIVAYDALVTANPWKSDTISEITMFTALRSLTLPLALGVLIGHLTWPGVKKNSIWVVLISLSLVLSLFITLDILSSFKIIEVSFLNFVRSWPILTVLLGIPTGRFAWPQVRS